MTGAELETEVQNIVGRESDTVLITDARCTRWLNQAQRMIAEKCPGVHELGFKNTTSVDFTQSLSFGLAEFTVGDDTASNHVCHVFGVHYLDGNESRELVFTHTDQFDSIRSDPTHSDYGFDKPFRWTRRGNNIEILPLSACAYCDKDMRLDGDFYPREFTTNDSSESSLNDADEGLILFATAKAWKAIGDEVRAQRTMREFTNPDPRGGEDFGWLEDYKRQNDELHEWDGGWYSDEVV